MWGMAVRWRIGGEAGRFVYVDDGLVCELPTHEQAVELVAAMNGNAAYGFVGSSETIHAVLTEARRADPAGWGVAAAVEALRPTRVRGQDDGPTGVPVT